MQRLFKILLIILILVVSVPMIFVGIYLFWEKDFVSNISQKTCVSNLSNQEISFDEKIRGFVLSQERSEYMEFSKEEVLSLLSSFLMNGNETFVVKDLCLDSEAGVWKAYLNIKVNNFEKIWFTLDIIKDKRETAELYVNNLTLGSFKIPQFLSDPIKQQVNKGISDALVLVNENSFSGRSITNIELLENKIVVKGTY